MRLSKVFIPLLLPVLLASCTREEVIVKPKNPLPAYRVSNLTDAVLNRSPFDRTPASFQQTIAVSQEGSLPKSITVGVTGLPAGLAYSFSAQTAATDFSSTFYIADRGAPAGRHEVQLTLKAAGDSVAKSFPFTVFINGDTSCTHYFSDRKFRGRSICDTVVSAFYEVNSVRSSASGDWILLQNFQNTGTALQISLNCKDRSALIPPQVFNGNTITGTGGLGFVDSPTPNLIYVNLEEKNSQGNVRNCSYSFTLTP